MQLPTEEPRTLADEPECLWDDAAFRERVRLAAADRDIDLQDLMERVGVAPGWLRHVAQPRLGRGTETILRIARELRVDPGDLMGLPEAPSEPAPASWRNLDLKRAMRQQQKVGRAAQELFTALHASDPRAARAYLDVMQALIRLLPTEPEP
jgi:transcriptional regulator with XRE-family HTH domain